MSCAMEKTSEALRKATRATLLRTCFERARQHRFYRAFYDGIEDFEKAPPTGKEVLCEALRDFSPDQEATGLYLVRSGGSTREPLVVPVDIAENLRQREQLAANLVRARIFGPQTVALNIFGYSDLYRSAAIFDDLLERCSATSLPMSAHAADSDLLAMVKRFRPSHLLGTPSRLMLFARYLSAKGLKLHVPNLVYAGEFLRDTAKVHLRETVGAEQFWSLYGAAETGIWAWCDASLQPGRFSILSGVAVEILSPNADGYGAIAVTNGWRCRFPVFRYRLGDVGRLTWVDGVEVLELLARGPRSFQFCELKHDLESLNFLVSDAETFQVQLTYRGSGHEEIRLLLVPRPCTPVSPTDLAERARSLRDFLQCPESMADVRVESVSRDRLFIDPATAKMPELVDLRR